MRILYVTDGGPGGISSHVRCLTQCLKGVADVMVCITQKTDALRQMLEEDGTPYYLCNCTSGHDPRLVFAVRRVVKTFKPDVVHLHDYRLFGALYLRWFTKIPRVCSIHLPSNPHPRFSRRLVNWAVQPCYWLPVSRVNWERFRTYHPGVRGEVFFNPVRIGGEEVEKVGGGGEWKGSTFTVGMVGRNAEVKDWPSFHKVEELVKGQFSGCLISDSLIEGAGKSNNPKSNNQTIPSVEFLNAGEHSLCDGLAAIRKMDLFLMTSKSEELPTVVLECFLLGTPVCGFIPRGGMHDILEFSKGPLKEVFIEERDCGKLADIVLDLMAHPKKRQALVEDGRQILEGHFDAEKNCKGQLMEIYKNCLIV